MGDKVLYFAIFIILLIFGALIYAFFKIRNFSKYVIKEEESIINNFINSENTRINEENQKVLIEDFPETNLDNLVKIPRVTLLKIFDSIENKDIYRLPLSTELAHLKIEKILEGQDRLELNEYFENPEFYNINIVNYKKEEGYADITFEIAVKYTHYILKGNEVVNGSKESLQEDIFQLSMAYIIDRELLNDEIKSMNIYGRYCTNCLEEVKTLSQIRCEYCGAELYESEDDLWLIIDFNRK